MRLPRGLVPLACAAVLAATLSAPALAARVGRVGAAQRVPAAAAVASESAAVRTDKLWLALREPREGCNDALRLEAAARSDPRSARYGAFLSAREALAACAPAEEDVEVRGGRRGAVRAAAAHPRLRGRGYHLRLVDLVATAARKYFFLGLFCFAEGDVAGRVTASASRNFPRV